MAWDPIRQEARWSGEVGRPAMSGILSTAGGLVFQGGKGARLHAYDAETGAELWSYSVETGAMAPPITYRIDGESFVAIAAGFGGGFAAEGGVIAHGWKTPQNPRVLVFKLSATEPLPQFRPREQRPLLEPAPATASAEVVARGKVADQRECAQGRPCDLAGDRVGRRPRGCRHSEFRGVRKRR